MFMTMEDPPNEKPTIFDMFIELYQPIPMISPFRTRLQMVQFGGPSLQLHPIHGVRLNVSLVDWVHQKYQSLFLDCHQIFWEYYGFLNVEPPEALLSSKSQSHYPRLDSLTFWHELIMVVTTQIVEIRVSDKMMARRDSELLASAFWRHLSSDLRNSLREHEKAGLCKVVAYLHLQNRVKWMYKTYVEKLPFYTGRLPEFETWFEPFVVEFMTERDIVLLKKLEEIRRRNRYYARNNAATQSVGNPDFSIFPVSSVLSHLTGLLNVIDEIETRDMELKKRYHKRYAETTFTAVEAYARLLIEDFTSQFNDIVIIMTLMTNIKLLKGQVHALMIKMGSINLEPNTASIFKDVCQIIDCTKFTLSTIYANRRKRPIDLKEHIYENVEIEAEPPKTDPPKTRSICLFKCTFKWH